MPDANGRIRGVSIPRVPWHEEPEPEPYRSRALGPLVVPRGRDTARVCPDCPTPAECVTRVYCVAESHGLDEPVRRPGYHRPPGVRLWDGQTEHLE